ncbi:uncharacterized protein LOC109811671 [Cajanus cajan]|uniref:uncharacterized protein LOC109811671 n=1 Tax=Cajanus cajan TaxID=3821 RepID=UPI0010FAD540|nr:uncharacterized protein LOC109811671 [Cajanus cajan]
MVAVVVLALAVANGGCSGSGARGGCGGSTARGGCGGFVARGGTRWSPAGHAVSVVQWREGDEDEVDTKFIKAISFRKNCKMKCQIVLKMKLLREFVGKNILAMYSMGLGVRPSQIIESSSRATSSTTSFESNEKMKQMQVEIDSLKAQVVEVDVLKEHITFLMQSVKGNETPDLESPVNGKLSSEGSHIF